MSKTEISTSNAPAALGPYSQAIKTDSMIFLSGQIAINPANGSIPRGVTAQTMQIFDNIEAILEEAGSSLDNVVKTTVFLKSMEDFASMNAAYEKAFSGSEFPARSCVEVSKLPKDVLVEIEVIALV